MTLGETCYNRLIVRNLFWFHNSYETIPTDLLQNMFLN